MQGSAYVSLFLRSADAHRDKPALICGGHVVSYDELKALFDHFVVQFHAGGWAGRRIGLYARSGPASVAASLAALHCGAMLVAVHHSYPLDNLEKKLRRTGCSLLISDVPVDGMHLDLNGHCLLPQAEACAAGIEVSSNTLAEVLDAVPGIACIFFTSGSTSDPKGVCVSDQNMVAAFEAVTRYMGNTDKDVILHYTALGLDYGFHNTMFALLYGGTNVIGGVAPADPQEILATIEAYRVTGLQALPAQLFCFSQPANFARYDTSTLRYISSTGQALPLNHIRNIRDRFPHTDLYSMYGMTECKRILYLPPDRIDSHPRSVGLAVPGLEPLLVHRRGDGLERAAEDEVAELAVASPQVMLGYWEDVDATGQAIRENVLGHDRILLTGDLFRRDADGLFYHVSRIDDCFPRNTFMVNPREVEAVISQHPDVLECRVGPVPNEREGNVPYAYIVPRGGRLATALAAEVEAACRATLDAHMIPHKVVITDSLPRSESGKLKTPEL